MEPKKKIVLEVKKLHPNHSSNLTISVSQDPKAGATDLHQPLGQGLRMQGPAKGLHLARMSYENALMRDEVLLSCYELKMEEMERMFFRQTAWKSDVF